MSKIFIRLTFAMALTLSSAIPSAQAAPPTAGLYEIVSGTYIECCGLAGDRQEPLPSASQQYILLTIDKSQNVASMSILGADLQTVYSVGICGIPERASFKYDLGLVLQDSIVFHVDPGPPPAGYWNYTVTNHPSGILLNGVRSLPSQFCADVPTLFTHTNVVAKPVVLPEASIRVSEVEVCWTSVSNATYQVQSRAQASTNQWENLGPVRTADGSTVCITDKITPGGDRRFYRVIKLP